MTSSLSAHEKLHFELVEGTLSTEVFIYRRKGLLVNNPDRPRY